MPSQAVVDNNNSPLSTTVYQRLLDGMTSLVIKPGDRITVDALVREWEISQTPIREALTRLEAEGLVVKHHLRGYRASDQLDAETFDEVFAIRALLEPAACGWAASNATDEQLDSLRALVAQMEPLALKRSYGEFALLDARFHEIIAASTQNDLLRTSIEHLHVHLHLFRLRGDHVVVDTAVEEHARILDAITRRDAIIATAAMKSHIDRSWRRLNDDTFSTTVLH